MNINPPIFSPPPASPRRPLPGWMLGLGLALVILSFMKLPGALGSAIFGTMGALGSQFHSEFEKALNKDLEKNLGKEPMSKQDLETTRSILRLISVVVKELLVPAPLLKTYLVLSGLWESLSGLIMLVGGVGLMAGKRWSLGWAWTSLIMSLSGALIGLMVGGISGGMLGWAVIAAALLTASVYTCLIVFFKTRDKSFLLPQA